MGAPSMVWYIYLLRKDLEPSKLPGYVSACVYYAPLLLKLWIMFNLEIFLVDLCRRMCPKITMSPVSKDIATKYIGEMILSLSCIYRWLQGPRW